MPCKPPHSPQEVLRLKSEGLTNLQIAGHFGISGSRVGQILEQERQRASSVEHSAALRNGISTLNGIDRKLSIAALFCVLNLPRRARTVLMAHFSRECITNFSLLDMMDLLIPIVEDTRDYYEHMPAYRVKMLGQILYADIIKAMSAVDCGEVFQAEWSARKKRLRVYLVGTKGFYPFILRGKRAALSEPD